MPEVVHGIEALRPEHGPLLLVVGVFDGLHRGHLYLLRELRRAGRRMGAHPALPTTGPVRRLRCYATRTSAWRAWSAPG